MPFNPDQPFEVVQPTAERTSFDPSKPFQTEDRPEAAQNNPARFIADNPDVRPLEGRLRGFEDVASLGLSDEAAGVGSAIAEMVASSGPHVSDRSGTPLQRVKQAYSEGRKSELSDVAQAKEQQPNPFMEGQATGFVGVGAAASPLLEAAPIRASTAIGATEGAARGEKTDERLKGAAVGGAVGLLGGAASKVASRFQEIGKSLGQEARDLSVRILKLKPGEIEGAGVKRLEKLGDMLVESEHTGGMATASTIAGKVSKDTQKTGAAIGKIFRGLDEDLANVPQQAVFDDAIQRAQQSKSISSSDTLEKVDAALKDFTKKIGQERGIFEPQNLSLDDTWELAGRMESAGRVFENSREATDNALGTVYRETAKALREQIAERAAQNHPVAAEELKALSQRYNSIVDADHALQRQVETSRFGKKELGSTIKSGVGNRVLTPIKSGAVSTLDFLSKRLKGSRYAAQIQRAALRGPQAIAAEHYVLSQTYPDYKELTTPEEDSNDQY